MNPINGLDKRIRIILMVVITAIVYAVFFVVVYPELLIVENVYLLMGVVIILGTIILIYFISEATESARERARERHRIHEKLRHYESMLAKETHTFYVSNAVKEIQILNKSGDAIVTYSFRCINNPESELKRIRISVSHDGNLIEGSVKCYVNERKGKMRDEERLVVLDAKSRAPKETIPNIFKFSILPEAIIEKGDRFAYSYTYRVDNLFRDFLQPDKEYTSTLILHPTDRLKNIIRIPEGYVFNSAKSEVFDRDEMEHLAEEQRIKQDCPPFFSKDKRILFWDISYPKLANIYRLRFSAKEEQTGKSVDRK